MLHHVVTDSQVDGGIGNGLSCITDQLELVDAQVFLPRVIDIDADRPGAPSLEIPKRTLDRDGAVHEGAAIAPTSRNTESGFNRAFTRT